MGKIKNKLDPDDLSDDSDRLSIKTDMSDDDFEFLMLDETEMPAFNHKAHSDTGSTLDDTDDLSSVFADSTSASKAKELVSAVVFRLSGLELLLQGNGPDVFARLQAKKIDVAETGNIVYEEFYSKLSSSRGIIRETPDLSGNSYPLKFKFISGPAAEKEVPRGRELGFMDVRINKYKFGFNMSSIQHMTSFIEDEKITTPTPMHVSVADLSVILKEDRPPPNATQPPPVSTVMNIHELFIYCYDDGVFHMTSGGKNSLSQKTENHVSRSLSPPVSEEPVIDPSLPSQDQIAALQTRNKQLQNLLKQLDDHSQDQDTEIEKLKKELEELKSEKKKWKAKSDELSKQNQALEDENQLMTQKLVEIGEELTNTKIERDSFDTMLKCLNDELVASEQRHRKHTGSSPNS